MYVHARACVRECVCVYASARACVCACVHAHVLEMMRGCLFVCVISIVSVWSWFCIYFVCPIHFCILRLWATLDVYALQITLLHYIYNGKHSAILCRMTGIFYVLLYLVRWWYGYRNKSQHRKLRGKLSRRICRDSNPGPFDPEDGAPPLSYPHSPCISFNYRYRRIALSYRARHKQKDKGANN